MKKISPFVRYDLPVIVRMMMPTFFLAAIALHFNEFILYAIMANKAINSGIICAALFGVVVILVRLFSLQRDMSALDRFSREAQATGEMTLLIDMPWIKGRAVWHYLQHIAHTEGTLASQLDQDAIQNELNALAEEYNSKMELPQFLVGFMIALGLLGTFIGLLETLTGISGMLDGMGHGGDIEQEFGKLIVELRKPLSGMGIAFSASMFGLVTSLLLSIMMIMLRRYTSRVMEKARSVMHRLLTRAKASVAQRGMLAGGENLFETNSLIEHSTTGGEAAAVLNEKMSEAYFRSQDAITSMANGVSLLVKRLDVVAKSLDSNIEAVNRTNSMLSFGPRMTEAYEEMANELRTVRTVQEDGYKLMQKIIGSLIQIDQSLMSSNTRDLVAVEREASATLTETFNSAQTQTRLMSELLEAQRDSGRDILLALKNLHDRVSKQNEAYVSSSQYLSDMKAEFSKLASSFGFMDSVAENIGRQTLLLESFVSGEQHSQKTLLSGLQKELHDFTSELRQALARGGEK